VGEPTRTLTILLVDADPAAVRLLQEVLTDCALPMTLRVVDRSETALAVLRQEGPYAQAPLPHVIFLDLELPRLEAVHLLDAIADDRALSAIPLVIFSGAQYPADHLLATGLVATSLAGHLEREQYLELLGKVLRHR
jgi:CheY-like chemotaxis protein